MTREQDIEDLIDMHRDELQQFRGIYPKVKKNAD